MDVRRHSKVCGRGGRGTTQSRGEILDLGIRLHLELVSHEFLINPGVLYRAGRSPAAASASMSFFVAPAESGSEWPACATMSRFANGRLPPRTVGKDFDRLVISSRTRDRFVSIHDSSSWLSAK